MHHISHHPSDLKFVLLPLFPRMVIFEFPKCISFLKLVILKFFGSVIKNINSEYSCRNLSKIVSPEILLAESLALNMAENRTTLIV